MTYIATISDMLRGFMSIKLTWIAVVLALPFLFYLGSYILGPKLPPGSPPLVQYKIPWLGHAIAFARDNNGFIERVKMRYPNEGITTLLLGGKTMYLVTDTNLASVIYRSSRSFAFDPLALLVSDIFGCDKSDMRILSKGANDYTVRPGPSEAGEKQPLLKQLHHMSFTQLQGESLDSMTNVFIQTLKANIEKEFPATQNEEWRELELIEFVKRHFTIASIASLFGTQFLGREGLDTLYSWLWDFDQHVVTLVMKLPHWMAGDAARSRDYGLEMLIRWERAAKNAEKIGLIGKKNEGVVWDEFWGLDFVRDRAKLVESYGVGEKGRAGLQMALLWAPIPSSPRDLPSTIVHEIQTSTTPSGSLNFHVLNAQPYLHSLLLETFRWATSSPGVRVVQADTQVGPYLLKQGGMVMIHARTLQLNPSIWGSDAQTFNTARFLERDSQPHNQTSSPNLNKDNGEKLKKLSMKAFGGGQNLCPGRHFAANEILGGFVAVMGLLEIEILEEEFERVGMPKVKVDDGKQGGLWPDRGMRVRVRRRRS